MHQWYHVAVFPRLLVVTGITESHWDRIHDSIFPLLFLKINLWGCMLPSYSKLLDAPMLCDWTQAECRFSIRSLSVLKMLVGVSLVEVLINIYGSAHGMWEGRGRLLRHHNQKNMCDSCYLPVVDAPMISFDDTLYKVRAHGVVEFEQVDLSSPRCTLSLLYETRVIFVCFRRQCMSTSLCMSIIATVVQCWNLLVNNVPWCTIYCDLV